MGESVKPANIFGLDSEHERPQWVASCRIEDQRKLTSMSLLSIFQRRKDTEPKVESVLLAVLFATAREGLSVDGTYALREIISKSSPLDFYFLNPGSFTVYFRGSDIGKNIAEDLASALREYARKNGIPSFGVAIQEGECIVAIDRNGRFASMPVGITINHAIIAAGKEADAIAR